MPDQSFQVAFSGTAVEPGFYSTIVSLTVEESTASAGSMDLRLATRLNDDGAWDMLDDSRLELFTPVSVKIGFTGGQGLSGALGGLTGGGDGLEPVFDGYITSVALDLSSDPGRTFIDVKALDTCVLMSVEDKVARWPNLADSDIATQILAAYGVAATVESTSTTHQEDNTTIVQRSTDLSFVRELARRNGMEFYFETDRNTGAPTGYFRAPQLEGSPQPDLAIHFGNESNLRSFRARVDGQRPLNVKDIQQDVQGNATNTAQVANTQRTKLGASDDTEVIGGPLAALLSPRDALAQMRILGHPTSDPAELRTVAQAVRDEAAWFITAQGEINSQAYGAVLRPRRLVQVKGAGTAHSGKYYVTRVVHELRGDGAYIQRFEARRNARGLDGSEQFGGNGLGLPVGI